MVDFNTRVFTEDDGKIIGAEITVYSDSGDKIGLIDVADAETLEEMQTQLAVIDETYFTEARLATILANTNENTVINATKLSGFLSSDFAKVSDLSSYAPVNHSHSKSQITDLYDYQIYASAYNVNIDGSVNITVKVTNRATGNPVVGVTVPVLKNNSSWKSGTTGVNGTFSLSYTADTWGITTFSANNNSIQINVQGWRKPYSDSNYDLWYNKNTVKLSAHINNTNFPTSWESFGADLKIASLGLKPNMPVVVPCYSPHNIFVAVRETDGKVYRVSKTGSTVNTSAYALLTWNY